MRKNAGEWNVDNRLLWRTRNIYRVNYLYDCDSGFSESRFGASISKSRLWVKRARRLSIRRRRRRRAFTAATVLGPCAMYDES